MRYSLKFYEIYLVFIAVCLLNLPSSKTHAQEVKKNRVRISVDYVKIMDAEILFNIKASARVNNEPVRVSDAELALLNEIGDEEVQLGTVTTDMNGESKFTLKSINAIRPDSTHTYTVSVVFKGNDLYKKASKSISFKDAFIKAEIQTKDSINFVKATLRDAVTQEPIPDQNLSVQVQRLFRPLGIGDPFNKTDEEGSILVPVEDGIPGVDGNLILEVVLNDSDDYGTVKALLPSSIGVPFEYESTFDQRTMWSPRNKTPLFLLIFPNIVTLLMWGFIFYLIFNLFRIVKS
jgi:hypothetical protein